MISVKLDFETKSGINLIQHGSLPYLYDKCADIICLGYKVDENKTKLWVPKMPLPKFFSYLPECSLNAFNAQFDLRVWHILGKKYKFPKTKLSQWIDVMAICGRFTYHQSLEEVGKDLELIVQKNKRGKQLMKKICAPPFEYTPIELLEFYDYCKTDVDSMYELIKALPASQLSKEEQKIWEMTVRINARGLPIDYISVKQILQVTDIYREEQNELLPGLTNGEITKATQTIKITKWIRSKGIILPNLQADTVEKVLKKSLPENVTSVLQLRQELGKSSVAKYLKIFNLIFHNRVYDNLRYYGANTGRWTGMGFQLLNLPRSKIGKNEVEPIIKKFFDLSIIEKNPIQTAKSIVRQMIKAPKRKVLIFGDYKSIEYVGLCWVTNDIKHLKRFKEGFDQYIDMASARYNVPYDEVTDEQRYHGKQLILGCGYGLGGKGFVGYLDKYGVTISIEDATEAIRAYRAEYNKVVKFWYACKEAAINAITFPGYTYKVSNTKTIKYKFVKDRNKTPWLQCTLPSNRNLYYNHPEIGKGLYGLEITAMGINPYTKKWMRLKVIPGRLAENIIQAMCRDILVVGKLNLEKAGYKIIGSIYDEVIVEVDKDKVNTNEFNYLMCKMPEWANGLLVEMESVIEKRYRKL